MSEMGHDVMPPVLRPPDPSRYPHVPVGSVISRSEPQGKRNRKCRCGSGKRAKSCCEKPTTAPTGGRKGE